MVSNDFSADITTLLASCSESILSLAQLKDEKTPFCDGATIFAIVKSVTARGMSRKSATTKTLQICDPTGTLDLESGDKLELLPGHIIRIKNLNKRVADNVVRFVCHQTTQLEQIPTFTFDYENKQPESFDKKFFIVDSHRDICKLLETWQASKILSWDFSKLALSQNKAYVDFACSVVGQRTTKRNINLIVWDGSKPSVHVVDQFKESYADKRKEFDGSFERNDSSTLSLVRDRVAHICVWMNESYSSIDHFETCIRVIPDRHSFLVFFNVEVAPVYDGLTLSMRSGHHQGKGVRVVSPQSILGRHLSSKLEEVIFDLELDAFDDAEAMVETTATVISKNEPVAEESIPSLSAPEEELFSRLPSHISRESLLRFTLEEIEEYETLLTNGDDVNFTSTEFGNSLSSSDFLRILAAIKKVKSRRT